MDNDNRQETTNVGLTVLSFFLDLRQHDLINCSYLGSQNADEIEWDKYWNPKIYVENNLGEPKETIWQTLMFNARGEATIYERRRIKGCFLENLELDEFPFDTQVGYQHFSLHMHNIEGMCLT